MELCDFHQRQRSAAVRIDSEDLPGDYIEVVHRDGETWIYATEEGLDSSIVILSDAGRKALRKALKIQ